MPAYICKRSKGESRFLKLSIDGKTKQIPLGSPPKAKSAQTKFFGFCETVKDIADELLASKHAGNDPAPAILAKLDKHPGIRDRFVSLGLCEVAEDVPTLRRLVDKVVHLKASVNEPRYQTTGDKLCLLFGDNKRVDQFTEGDAEEFVAWLLREGDCRGAKPKPMSEAAVSREAKRMRTIFKTAQKSKWRYDNPFADIKAGSQANQANWIEIDRGMVTRLLSLTDDPELRLAIALARFGAMRIDIEVLKLRWEDVKEDHISVLGKGGKRREVPIFPALRPFLAERGQGRMIRYQYATITNRLKALIKRAEFDLWPEPWHQMKRSRITELSRIATVDDIAKWVGTTPPVLREHYIIHDPATGVGVALPDPALPNSLPTGAAQSRTEADGIEEKYGIRWDAALCGIMQELAKAPVGRRKSVTGLTIV